jgi:CheY-like chemotaxis protein
MSRPTFSRQSNPKDNTSLRGVNIVLIDDEPSVLFALQLLLKAIGYSVLEFQSPAKAIQYFDTWELTHEQNNHSQPEGSGYTPPHSLIETCHVVLSDLRMPEMDGFDVIRHIRQRKPELPIILMSAHASQREQDLAIELGCNAFLAKPFTPDQLHSLIDSLVITSSDSKITELGTPGKVANA